MKFGYIAPTKHLHQIPQSATFHLILAHLLVDPEYVAFYNKCYDKGHFILLDNSAFEFGYPIEAEELIRKIDESGIKVHCVVAPDYPGQPSQKTIDSAISFANKLQELGRSWQIMVVPQSEKGNHVEWLDCYRFFLNDPRFHIIGMSILGVPNAFCKLTGTEDISINRIFATSYLLKLYRNRICQVKWHHYLGLGSNVREMQIIKNLAEFNQQFGDLTNDSSSPIWHGYNNIKYDNTPNGLIDGKTKISVDFNAEFKSEEAIQYNIDLMEQFIS